jgi:hypothetical protein
MLPLNAFKKSFCDRDGDGESDSLGLVGTEIAVADVEALSISEVCAHALALSNKPNKVKK